LLHIFSLLSSFYQTLDLRCRVCPVFYFAVKIQNNALIHAIFTKIAAVGVVAAASQTPRPVRR